VKQASIQAGSINNLVTVDAANLDSFSDVTAGGAKKFRLLACLIYGS
jgi:hypothetical protein